MAELARKSHDVPWIIGLWHGVGLALTPALSQREREVAFALAPAHFQREREQVRAGAAGAWRLLGPPLAGPGFA